MSQASKKLISVVISTYNRAESLRIALGSLLSCRVNDAFDYELIVVDNNSKDHTARIIREMMPKFNGRIKYLFEPKQGRSYALNTAIQQSKGEYIAMTDDDCLVDQDWLIRIVEILSSKDIDILTGKIMPQIDRTIPAWVNIQHKTFWGPLGRFDLGDKYIENTKQMIFAPGANFHIRRESLNKFGGFKKEFRGQDTELCYRWQKQGAKVGYSPRILILHRTQPELFEKKYLRQWYFYSGKNSALIFQENYSLSKRRMTRVPLWLYKRLFQKIWCYLKHMFSAKNMFIYELWIWFYLGEISGAREAKMNFDKSMSDIRQRENEYAATV